VNAPLRGADAIRSPPMGSVERRAWFALMVLLVAAGAFVYHETRGTTLWFDEWQWALDRRGSNLDTFLDPHNGHLSLVPVAIYKLLFATAGLGDYRPYRVVVIVAHLICVLLVFVYARRRVNGLVALLAAALLLFFGPGWQDILWPFQVGWLVSLAAGVGALLMLDRADRLGDVAACVLLGLSLASSSIGIPIALGLAVDVLWGRRRWRDTWTVAAPVALYALWWLPYHDTSTFRRHNLLVTPGFVADAAAGAVAALAGLGGSAVPDGGGTLLEWGRPLGVAAATALAWQLARSRPIPPRVVALLTMVLSFWTLTGVSRAQISPPYASRYLYVGALLVVLLAVEVARGAPLSWPVGVLLVLAVIGAIVSNVGALRDGATYLRAAARSTTADLGALELARPLVGRDSVARAFPGYPFLVLRAGPYFAAQRTLGSPAATPAEIATEPEDARRVADAELISIHQVGLRPSRPGLRSGAKPAVDGVTAGAVSGDGACVRFRPAGVTAANAGNDLDLILPPGGIVVTAEGGPATVSVRRFADEYQPVAKLAASATAMLRIGPDGATQPWRVRVAPAERATVCGMA
jgi:hypothetical protein